MTKEQLLQESNIKFEVLPSKWQNRITRKEKMVKDKSKSFALVNGNKRLSAEQKIKSKEKIQKEIDELNEEIIDDVASAIAEYEIMNEEVEEVEKLEKPKEVEKLEEVEKPKEKRNSIFTIFK